MPILQVIEEKLGRVSDSCFFLKLSFTLPIFATGFVRDKKKSIRKRSQMGMSEN
jgi:hypothetical protein